MAVWGCQVTTVVSDSVRPHGLQPTRLLHLWDSPGKNTGVGFHFLLQCMKVESESEVTQSCLTLSNPMDCSLPGSSVHGIFQARVLEWGAIAFSGQISKAWHFTIPNSLLTNFFLVLCFWTMVLKQTLESPLDCKEVKSVNPKGNQPEFSLERLMLKLKLQYFGHLIWRVNSFEKILRLGKIEGKRRREQQRMRW